MPWTFYTATGQQLKSTVTNISNLDIDGATDIGAAIVDADLFIIDDGAGGTNRKTEASRLKTYIGTEASKANMEAEATGALYVPPDLVKDSPGVAKGWVRVNADGTIFGGGSEDYNVASITDVSTGRRVVVWDTDFADTNYVCLGNQFFDNGNGGTLDWDSAGMATGSITVRIRTSDATYSVVDMASCHAGFGEH
jgi:hypothetical protein